MNDSINGSQNIGLNAVPKWRIFAYLAIYFAIIGGSAILDQYENPSYSIWKSFLLFSIFFSVPPAYFIWLNKFTNKDYALKYLPVVMRSWYVVMAIQIILFVVKQLAEK